MCHVSPNISDGPQILTGGTMIAHPANIAPSRWVCRFSSLVAPNGKVLDYACGRGRHARWLAGRGFRVVAVDRDAEALGALAGVAGVRTMVADLEGGAWPIDESGFDAIVITNYLFRPRLARLIDCLAPGGVLIYETFMRGNERFGRPANPEFLLDPGELIEILQGGFTIVAFEQGEVSRPKRAMIQRVCAIRGRERMACLPMR